MVDATRFGGGGIVPVRSARGWTLFAALAVAALTVLVACGEGGSATSVAGETDISRRSSATFLPMEANQVLTEADAGKVIETERFIWDIGLLDKKGTEIILEGDDASTLRWRIAEKPDPFHLDWVKVDGEPAFETDGLVGDPTTAAKVLEFHGQAEGGPHAGGAGASGARSSQANGATRETSRIHVPDHPGGHVLPGQLLSRCRS